MSHGERSWPGIHDSYATWRYVDADRQLHTLNERLCTLAVRGIYDVYTNNLRVYRQLLCFLQYLLQNNGPMTMGIWDETVIACDTSSHTHGYLCPVWKWYIQNCMHCRVIKFVRNYVVPFSSRSLDFLWTYSFLFLFIIPLMITVFWCHCCDTDVGQENIFLASLLYFVVVS